MATSDRPSGLTALAVINFIFSIADIIGAFSLIVGKVVVVLLEEEIDDVQDPGAIALQELSVLALVALVVLAFLSGVLLVLSGIGYLQRKRILGRWLGNAYAVVAVAFTVTSISLFSSIPGGGVTLDAIRSLFYPVLTVLMVNVVFRKDLVQ